MILRSVLQPISVERRISFESKSLPIRLLDLLLLGDSSRETLKKNHKPPLSIFVSFLCSHLLPLDAFLPLVCRFFDSHFSFLPLVSLSTHSGFYIPREKNERLDHRHRRTGSMTREKRPRAITRRSTREAECREYRTENLAPTSRTHWSTPWSSRRAITLQNIQA